MATACGVMVSNIYICQPLLGSIARDFGVPESMSALVAVATQVGYALGILLLVPLADVANPKTLLRWLMGLTAFALIGAAFSPTIHILILASISLAVTTVAPQILIPLATSLVPAERRGRVVGSMMQGLTLGILLSRTVSGIVAELTGSFRASFAVAAILTLVLFMVLPSFLREKPQSGAKLGYLQLLASLPGLLRHRLLVLSMAMNFFAFAAFSGLWSTLAFHLEAPPFGLGAAAAGLFGLWGAPGTLLSPLMGRLVDRYGSSTVNSIGFVFIFIAFIVAGTWGALSVIGLVVAVNMLDFGIQSGQIANQTRIFAIGPEIRARLNTLYMFSSFSGGAIGAYCASRAWTAWGWTGVCTMGAVFIAAAATILVICTVVGSVKRA
jgi:predicted MFS family arabinose efflux permease